MVLTFFLGRNLIEGLYDQTLPYQVIGNPMGGRDPLDPGSPTYYLARVEGQAAFWDVHKGLNAFRLVFRNMTPPVLRPPPPQDDVGGGRLVTTPSGQSLQGSLGVQKGQQHGQQQGQQQGGRHPRSPTTTP